jgi:hypothetical protein
MSFVTVNNYDVEHASQLLIYDNLFPEIKHINGKGVNDTYTKSDDVESVTYIDVMRVLPYAPRFRQLGSANNGTFHNQKNEGGFNNAPQSVHYTIPVDLIYDEGVAITSPQIYANPVKLKSVIMAQLIKTAGLAINTITYAKQIEAFFRDSYDGTGADITNAGAAFPYDATLDANSAGSAADAFIAANAALSDGIPSIGALVVPIEERQAFVSTQFNRIMKRQYMQNASEASARILADGFINPFKSGESVRITSATGLCGMYDGVDMFLMNNSERKLLYLALGVPKSESANAAVVALLDTIDAFIVYGAGTCRGIVGPSLEANPNVYFGGVYILPKMKVGVEVLSGETIKVIKSGAAWTADNILAIAAAIKFTPIDGVTVTGNDIFGDGALNDGTTN